MTAIAARALPPDSLLAGFGGPGDYTDCFTCELPRPVTLGGYISAFYNSACFRPERWFLHLIGKGSGKADVARLAACESGDFAAWKVIERTGDEILLQDFQHRTCSWLKVEPHGESSTRLSFGSGVRHPEGAAFRLLIPLHRRYAVMLLGSAARGLTRTGRTRQ